MATDETRARIIEAAGPIFAEKGFRDATVREICEAAGVGLASVNYHFRDKQHLYARVVEAAFDDMARLRPPLTDWPPGTPPEVRLKEWIERLANHVLADVKDSWQDRLLAREIQEPTPACDDVLRQRIDLELAPLDAILVDVLPAGAGADERRLLAFSIIGQILIYDTHRVLVRLLYGAPERKSGVPDAAAVSRYVQRVSLAALGRAPHIGRSQADDPDGADRGIRTPAQPQAISDPPASSGDPT
jgi:AcrR family transcriptional regulator